MSRKKFLFIGACGHGYSVKGGEIAKCRVIERYLKTKFQVRTIDTYWESKNIIQRLVKLTIGRLHKFFQIIFWSLKADLIVVCSSYIRYLKPIDLVRCLKKTVVFGVGGRVPTILLNNAKDLELLNRLADIMVESQRMADEFATKGVLTAHYVPNFKFLPNFSKCFFERRDSLALFFIGKICAEKGCDDIIRAVNDLNKAGIHCDLDLYGPVESEFSLKKMMNDHIRYKGYIDLVESLESYDRLRQYDLFIFPSKWEGEGFAGALIDAMSLGKPIIASKHNVIPDIVTDNVTGLLFETGNIIEMKEKIQYFYFNREELYRFGERCLSEAKKYDVTTVLDEVIGKYL